MTPTGLPMEKQFALARYKEMIKGITKDELEDLFVELMRQKMVLEEMFGQELKRKL